MLFLFPSEIELIEKYFPTFNRETIQKEQLQEAWKKFLLEKWSSNGKEKVVKDSLLKKRNLILLLRG